MDKDKTPPLADFDEVASFRCVWHVRHRDGTEEDIVLEHGNLVEDNKGSVGQFLIYLR